MSKIIIRNYTSHALDTLIAHGIHPVLARVFAARGIAKPDQIKSDFADMKNIGGKKSL